MAGGSERTNSGVQVGSNIIAQSRPGILPNCALGGNPRGDALHSEHSARPDQCAEVEALLDSGRFFGKQGTLTNLRLGHRNFRIDGHSPGTHRPDLEHAKIAALNSLSSPDVRRGYLVRS